MTDSKKRREIAENVIRESTDSTTIALAVWLIAALDELERRSN